LLVFVSFGNCSSNPVLLSEELKNQHLELTRRYFLRLGAACAIDFKLQYSSLGRCHNSAATPSLGRWTSRR